jgi:hypothetical protein
MNVLVASDGSESAGRAVEFAARLAIGLSAELVIVTVAPDVRDADLQEFSRAEDATVGDVLEATARTRLALARGIAEKTGPGSITTETRDGDPAEVILDRAGFSIPQRSWSASADRGDCKAFCLEAFRRNSSNSPTVRLSSSPDVTTRIVFNFLRRSS